MSSDEKELNIARGRGRRSNVSGRHCAQSKALEALKEARQKGTKYRARITEEDDYKEVTEEEYTAERQRDRAFIEGADDEYFDDEDDEDLDGERQSKKEKEKKTKKAKFGRGTITQSFQRIAKKTEQITNIEDDPVLKECMSELAFGDADYDVGGEEEDGVGPAGAVYADNDDGYSAFSCFSSNGAGSSGVKPLLAVEKSRNSQKRPASPTNPFLVAEAKRLNLNHHDCAIADELPKPPPKPTVKKVSVKAKEPKPDQPATIDMTFNAVECEEEMVEDENGDVAKEEIIEEQDVIRFYYLDAFEDAMRHPGTVYLFGQIKAGGLRNYESCCVVVKNVSRQVFFQKRETNAKTGEPVTDADLRNEVRDVLQREYSVTKYKSMIVIKHFLCRDAAEGDREATALEVHFNANFGRIPPDLSGRTFDRVFNTTTTSMERIVVDQEIKGPCWVDVHKAGMAVIQNIRGK